MIRINNLVGKYRKYDGEEIHRLIESFFSPQNDPYRPRFINEMHDLMHVGKVTRTELEKTVTHLSMELNVKALMIMLMRESNSLNYITAEAIKAIVETIHKEEKKKSTKSSIPTPVVKQQSAPEKYEEFTTLK